MANILEEIGIKYEFTAVFNKDHAQRRKKRIISRGPLLNYGPDLLTVDAMCDELH